MSDGFLQFKPSTQKPKRQRGAGTSTVPYASISKSGMMRFNKAAATKYGLNNETLVLLFYSKAKKIIGLKIVKTREPDAVKFYNHSSGTDELLGVKPFMESCGIAKVKQSMRAVTQDKETGMILIHDVTGKNDSDFEQAVNRSTP